MALRREQPGCELKRQGCRRERPVTDVGRIQAGRGGLVGGRQRPLAHLGPDPGVRRRMLRHQRARRQVQGQQHCQRQGRGQQDGRLQVSSLSHRSTSLSPVPKPHPHSPPPPPSRQ